MTARASFQLVPHLSTPCAAVSSLDIDVEVSAGVLRIDFRLQGDVHDIKVPKPAAPTRQDNLWQTTCFELFVKTQNNTSYAEFNFSPSSEWAIYLFEKYRHNPSVPEISSDPTLTSSYKDHELHVSAELQITLLQELGIKGPCPIALSAVVEETSGDKAYFALTHPGGSPDFHHSDCFTGNLPLAR